MENQNSSASCHNNKGSNILKFGVLVFLGIILFAYSLFLATGNVGKVTDNKPAKSTDRQVIEEAKETLEKNLDHNSYGFIKEYKDKENYLEVKVIGSAWKKLAIKDKKTFLKDVADARSSLGFYPNISVIDHKSSVEFASFENNRVTLAELDF